MIARAIMLPIMPVRVTKLGAIDYKLKSMVSILSRATYHWEQSDKPVPKGLQSIVQDGVLPRDVLILKQLFQTLPTNEVMHATRLRFWHFDSL